ncbi:MAG: sulfate respiration complex protein HmcE [Desulfovibrionaceae bacterium]
MYEFLTGPMLWLAFIIFFGGCAARVWLYIKGLNWQLDRVAYGYFNDYAVRGALKSVFFWLVPFVARSWRKNPFFTLMFFGLHVGIVCIPLFLTAHVVFMEQRLGISLPTLGGTAADALTVAAMVSAAFIVLRRIALPEVRIITTAYDYLLIAITIAPFVTGFIAAHQPADYAFWLLAHVITAEVWLIAVPFTKLSHAVLFFCSRAQLGVDYGIKRGGMKGRGIAW